MEKSLLLQVTSSPLSPLSPLSLLSPFPLLPPKKGANTGLGFSSVVNLASKGAEVIMACRSKERCNNAVEKARERVKGVEGKGKVVGMLLDLSSFVSIKGFAKEFLGKYERLDSLMLNAGIMWTEFWKTEQGIESQIGLFFVLFFFLVFFLFCFQKNKQTFFLTLSIKVSTTSATTTSPTSSSPFSAKPPPPLTPPPLFLCLLLLIIAHMTMEWDLPWSN